MDIKFEPCGHAMMCSTCAQRAKKCPQCKVGDSQGFMHTLCIYYYVKDLCIPCVFMSQTAVKSFSKLKVMCLMCTEEEATVTMRPCGHMFCPG